MALFRFDGKVGYAVYEGQDGALSIGKFSSVTAGYGLQLTNAKSFAFCVCADDNKTVFASGSAVKASESRLLLTGKQTGSIAAFGGYHHLKVASDCSGVTGFVGGSWGHVEMVAGAKIGVAGAFRAYLECPSTAVVSSNLSALLVAAGDISGTHTGPVSVINVTTPQAGTFDFFATFSATTGCIATQSGGTLTITKKIPIKDDAGNTIYIAAGTIA